MQKLKVNDEVLVVAGKEKGKSGKIKKINFKKDRVVVAGINLVKKTIKPTQDNPNGGIVDIEASLHRSNVMVVSPKTKKPTRVKIQVVDGKKARVAVTCGSVL